jgi:putative ABC transport system permease protein
VIDPATRLLAALRSLTQRRQLDADMDEEMRFHLEMHAERLQREQNLDRVEARRRAHVDFGGVEKYREASRDTRGWRWLDAISLDSRLGLRMLFKHRGLTVVGGFAMAVAIAIGATLFETFSELLQPGLPWDDGDRIVSLQNGTGVPGDPERRVWHDFVEWREQVTSIEHLGAFRTAQHNLLSPNVPPEPIKVAEITASAFAMARTPPMFGRYLLPSDEAGGAAPVVLIGHQAWQVRFSGDPTVVGQTIHLGGLQRTVVGVMPEGFSFPVNHQFWIPLQIKSVQFARLQGPEIYIFGRLVDGITIDKAQAELTTIGQRAAAAFPDTHARLSPQVLPYTREHLDLSEPIIVWLLRVAQILVGSLTFVVAVNLAILFYARTVTRLGEIAVRTALGASRARILTQLFIEALALAGVGAVAGLAVSNVALDNMQALAHRNGAVPFWIDFSLSATTAAYVVALAMLAALIMGVLPGLKATGRRVRVNLHEANNRAGTRLGSVWTTLIVGQVATAVAVLPVAVYFAGQLLQLEFSGSGIADEQFYVATMTLGDDDPGDRSRVRARQLGLMSLLEQEPGVAKVTFSSSVPGFSAGRSIEPPEGATATETGVMDVSSVNISVDLFDVYDAEMLSGRALRSGDVGISNVVVVNRSFAEALGGANPLGLRFRYSRSRVQVDANGMAWYEIVGVVNDFPGFPAVLSLDTNPTIYHPAAPGDIHPVVLSIRFADAIHAGFAERVRVLGADVDPSLQMRRVVPLSEFYRDVRSLWRYLAWGIGLLTLSVLLLSAAGIYALMSFTVAQRTREIGIRTALGGQPRHILLNVFGRGFAQVATGVLIGSTFAAVVLSATGLDPTIGAAVLLVVVTIMVLVGGLATLGPARRSLRVQASEALRVEA